MRRQLNTHKVRLDEEANQRRDDYYSDYSVSSRVTNPESSLNNGSKNLNKKYNRNRGLSSYKKPSGSDYKNKQYIGSSGRNKTTKVIENQRTNNNRVMPFRQLEQLIDEYHENLTHLFLKLKRDNTFLNLISNEDELRGRSGGYVFLCKVIRVLSMVSDCDHDLLTSYFKEINATDFGQSIANYLCNFTNLISSRNRKLHVEALENLVKFLVTYQILLQESSIEKISLILDHLNVIVMSCNRGERVISQESVQLIKLINSKIHKNSSSDNEDSQFSKNVDNPNDFRNISIFPTTEDIRCIKRSPIPKNIIEGKYDSVDHYLDVQFRLLREDFIRPLREGINEYLNNLKTNKPNKKFDSIRLYFDVKITGSEFNNGLVHRATFNIKDYKHVRWQNSKQLIYGSMLCLTSNNFKTFCLATVAGNRDPKLLSKGKFELQFEAQTMNEDSIDFTSSSIVMAEANAYFEACRHNLLALQRFKSDEFPLKDYIIDVSTDIKYLSHLNGNTFYDLSDLSSSLEKISLEKMQSIIASLSSKDYYNANITFLDKMEPYFREKTSVKQNQLKHVCMLNDLSWPNASQIGVDDSQYEAIKAALIKPLTIIQGPPGTGKTHVGLKIVQTLLRNKSQWNTRQSSSPILVVCYTNHALDQFLEGMVPFCKIMNGIVRMGSRCQSEILDRYKLTNLRRQREIKRLIPYYILSSLENTRNQLLLIQEKLSSIQNEIQECRTRILGNKLKISIEKMKPNYKMIRFIEQLRSLYDESFESALIKWLTTKVVAKKVWVDIDQTNEDFIGSNGENQDHLIIERKIKLQNEIFSDLSSDNLLSDEEITSVINITQMSHNNRWRLYRSWHRLYRQSKLKELTELSEEFDEKSKYLKKLKAGTSYCAKNINLNQYGILLCEQELRAIKSHVYQVEFQVLECRKKFLGSELSKINGEYDEAFRNITQQLLRFYGKNFDLALIKWLSNEVVLTEVWQEVESSEDLQSDFATEDEIDEIESCLSSHSESEDSLEFNEEEVQDMIGKRIVDNEHYLDHSTNHRTDNGVPVEEENNAYGYSVTKKRRKQLQKQIENELSSDDIMAYHEIMGITDLSKLSTKDRWRLYRYWLKNYRQEKDILIKELNKEYDEKLKQFERIKLEQDLFVIKDCDILGLTTTGAAKFRNIIEQIDPLIVIVEEAAEVLESHVVTALTKGTKHLILIGDHQQLKPKPTVYDLAVNYNLDVSLFERMIKNGLPYHQLKIQHRMRPCISSLLVPHIYKELRDHESVKNYEDIRGVSKNMFFINHNHCESVSTNDGKSKKNQYEAEYIVRFCKYLILQEYKPSQITILTTYSAQCFLIKQLVEGHEILNEVRVTVLDNYQGEECDIILLSFVRSNVNGEIGFLKVPNRVNVGLSRARMAMYCIGNFDCLSKKSQLLYEIKKKLIRTGKIGTELELFCQNHPKNKTIITKPSDFDKVPDGGCREPCIQPLECGHICGRFCHNNDKEHKTNICDKKCLKTLCELQHECKDKCHFPNKCMPCPVIVNKTIPSCGHQIKLKCSTDPSTARCTNPCSKILSCGHPCTQICPKDCNEKLCTFKVTVDSKCGHRVEVECRKQSDVETQLKCCREKCDAVLQCQHICQRSCGECHQKSLHIFCHEKCKRELSCGHVCKALCGQNCNCKQNCQSMRFKICEPNRKSKEDLIEQIQSFQEEIKLSNIDSDNLANISGKLNKLKSKTMSRNILNSEYFMVTEKFKMIKQITGFKRFLFDWKSKGVFMQITKYTNSLNTRLDQFLTFIDTNYFNNLQQFSDAKNEMNRFVLMSEILELIVENEFLEEGKQLLIEAFDILSRFGPFTDYIELKIRLLVSYAEKYQFLKHISDLSPEASIIKLYFNNTKAHEDIKIAIKSIKRYNFTEFSQSFRSSFSKDKRMLLWHGTRQKYLKSIFSQGLKLPEHGGMFGKGIYFADRVTKSARYTNYSTGIGTLFLCEVAVGNMYKMTTANHHFLLPNGYQSVKGVGKQIADPLEELTIENNLIVPLGKTMPDPQSSNVSLEYDEYVIYDPKRALIRFIVEIEPIE